MKANFFLNLMMVECVKIRFEMDLQKQEILSLPEVAARMTSIQRLLPLECQTGFDTKC